MELRDRLSLWREVILAKPQEEDGAITAGRKAEEFLHQLIKNNIAFKGGYAFAGKRIPHPTERRRYEVDMMVLTNKSTLQKRRFQITSNSSVLVDSSGNAGIDHKIANIRRKYRPFS